MIPKFILADRQRIRLGVAVRIRSHLHTIDRYPAAGRLICMVRRCYRHSGVLMTERRNDLSLPPLEKEGGSLGKRHPRSIREHRVAPTSFFFSFAWTFFFFFLTDPSIRSTNWRSKVDPRNDVKCERVLHS